MSIATDSVRPMKGRVWLVGYFASLLVMPVAFEVVHRLFLHSPDLPRWAVILGPMIAIIVTLLSSAQKKQKWIWCILAAPIYCVLVVGWMVLDTVWFRSSPMFLD